MKTFILIMSLVISLTSCSDDDNSQTTEIEFTQIGKGHFTGDGAEGIEKQNISITNEENWNLLKLQMNTLNNYTDSFLETEIDFSKYMIIASFNEIKNQGEFSIEISEIVENSKNITVSVQHIGSGSINAISITSQPFVIVKIPKSNLPIVFKETNIVTNN